MSRDRQNRQAKEFLGNLHFKRQAALNTIGRYKEAVADLGKAIEWTERSGRRNVFLRMQRSRTRALAGDHRQAIAEAEELINEVTSARILYRAACVCSLASKASKDDAKQFDEQRAKVSEQYALRAVELLNQVRETGYLNESRIEYMMTDADLNPIRSRDDFVKCFQESKEAVADTRDTDTKR